MNHQLGPARDRALAIYETRPATDHHSANNPRRGAVLMRAEDGHDFLCELPPQALSAAINEGNLTARCVA